MVAKAERLPLLTTVAPSAPPIAAAFADQVSSVMISKKEEESTAKLSATSAVAVTVPLLVTLPEGQSLPGVLKTSPLQLTVMP